MPFNNTHDYWYDECQQLSLLISESVIYRLGFIMSFYNSLRVDDTLPHCFLDEFHICDSYCLIDLQ